MVKNENPFWMRGYEITMLKPADEKIIKISKEIYLVGLWSFSSGADRARLQCKRASLFPATDDTGDCGFIFQLNVISRVDYKCFLVCCTLSRNGSQQRPLQREQHHVQSTINFFRLACCS